MDVVDQPLRKCLLNLEEELSLRPELTPGSGTAVVATVLQVPHPLLPVGQIHLILPQLDIWNRTHWCDCLRIDIHVAFCYFLDVVEVCRLFKALDTPIQILHPIVQ